MDKAQRACASRLRWDRAADRIGTKRLRASVLNPWSIRSRTAASSAASDSGVVVPAEELRRARTPCKSTTGETGLCLSLLKRASTYRGELRVRTYADQIEVSVNAEYSALFTFNDRAGRSFMNQIASRTFAQYHRRYPASPFDSSCALNGQQQKARKWDRLPVTSLRVQFSNGVAWVISDRLERLPRREAQPAVRMVNQTGVRFLTPLNTALIMLVSALVGNVV